MSATAAFLSAWRASSRSSAVLVKIALRDVSTLAATRTVYLSTRALTTPDGQYWAAGLSDVQSISAPGSFVETDVPLCSTSFSIGRSRLIAQSEIKDVIKSLSESLWDNARVTIYLWETSLTDFGDALQVFAGNIVAWSADAKEVRIDARQRADWNRTMTPRSVSIEEFPMAPEDSIGQALPTYYGRVPDAEFRSPFLPVPIFKREGSPAIADLNASTVLGGRRAGPAILVDTGRGAGAANNPKAKVLVAGHKLRKIGDRTAGLNFYLRANDGTVAAIDSLDLADVFNNTDGAGFVIADSANCAWAHAVPADIEAVSVQANNPRAILDPFNDQNYVRFNWTNNEKQLRCRFSGIDSKIGDMTNIYIFGSFDSPNGWTDIRARVINTVTGVGSDMFLASIVPAVPNPTSGVFSFFGQIATGWGGLMPTVPWSIGDLLLEFGWPQSSASGVSPVNSAAGSFNLYNLGFLFRFIPRQDVIVAEQVFNYDAKIPVPHARWGSRRHSSTVFLPHVVHETKPATTELVGKFYANVEGYADDAAGTDTGTQDFIGPGTLIERACDVASHLLKTFAGETEATLVRDVEPNCFGASTRAKLKTWNAQDMKAAFFVSEQADVSTALAWLSAASASMFFIDRFTDKWKVKTWLASEAPNYAWKFRRADLSDTFGVRVSTSPTSQLITGVRLNYGYDAITRNFRHNTGASYNSSSAPFLWRGIRDEQLAVIAGKNDRLDFMVTISGPFTASLTAGSYTPDTFVPMLDAAITAACGSTASVIWGGQILSAYNDRLSWTAGATTYTSDMPQGVYTMDAIAAWIQATIAPTAAGFLASFSRADRKFHFTYNGAGLLRINGSLSGSTRAKRFAQTIGIDSRNDISIVNGNMQSQYAREEETFAVGIVSSTLASFLHETGANGLNGAKRSAASLIGQFGLRDKPSTADVVLGDSPTNSREKTLAGSVARYGARRDVQLDLRAVYDSSTAREVRNRLVALLGRARVSVEFATEKAPDVERGHVIQFDSDLDAALSYPLPGSDGSWVGKSFVVVETEQLLGPTALFTRIRAVSLD